ncbi:helix-turn-helix domain-containing protein [Candidatus Woesearchaeota archaeon]|nr:helix-turn-helix domain-containing protein [Candidatus Woesearchaeota archaeon]
MTQNFLLVDLNEKKTKKLAETITSDTSRKILNHLANKEDSEQNISTSMKIPISTVHYHLLKLVEAELVVVEEFHYSEKGRVINHYKLANKYIIIAPRKISGLREKLKNILPVAIIFGVISVAIKLITTKTTEFASPMVTKSMVLEESADFATVGLPLKEEAMNQIVTPETIAHVPEVALWFLAGGITAGIIYVVYAFIKNKIK